MHAVVALALPAVEAFDLAIPAQVFGDRRQNGRYTFTVCAPVRGLVPSTTGYAVNAVHGLEQLARADTVVVPGYLPLEDPGEEVCSALRQAAARGARVVSVCTGAFALAAAGLLDNRRATTHWQHAAELAARHPAVKVDPDRLWVDEGSVLTSAGLAAGIDARRNVPALPFIPFLNLYIVTCIDCRVDPAEILGINLGEALVERNIGGRVTPAVIRDIAYAGYLVESKAPEGPWFEVAIIHHTDCGSTLLANDELRHGFAERIGVDERTLTDTPVLDPERTVRTDVDRVLWAREIPSDVRVSGHVYDVSTGVVTTVVDAKSRT